MKFLIVLAVALGLGGCGFARDTAALMWCAAHQYDANRRCT